MDPSEAPGGSWADRTAIADIVYGYARNVREGNGAANAALFVDDAVFEMYVANLEDGTPELHRALEGRDAIIAHIVAGSRPGARVCPMIHNLVITLDGDRATSDCTMSAVTIPAGADLVGCYQDSFRRDGTWRFVSRKHTVLLHREGDVARNSVPIAPDGQR